MSHAVWIEFAAVMSSLSSLAMCRRRKWAEKESNSGARVTHWKQHEPLQTWCMIQVTPCFILACFLFGSDFSVEIEMCADVKSTFYYGRKSGSWRHYGSAVSPPISRLWVVYLDITFDLWADVKKKQNNKLKNPWWIIHPWKWERTFVWYWVKRRS